MTITTTPTTKTVFIPIGLQCSVPDALVNLGVREYSYPFDWLWSPARSTRDVLRCLVVYGVDATVQHMTVGSVPCQPASDDGAYRTITTATSATVTTTSGDQKKHTCYMNARAGLCFPHFSVDAEYQDKLRRRLERMFDDLRDPSRRVVLVYADGSTEHTVLSMDGVRFGAEDPAPFLRDILHLVHSVNAHTRIIQFARESAASATHGIEVVQIPFNVRTLHEVTRRIERHLTRVFSLSSVPESSSSASSALLRPSLNPLVREHITLAPGIIIGHLDTCRLLSPFEEMDKQKNGGDDGGDDDGDDDGEPPGDEGTETEMLLRVTGWAFHQSDGVNHGVRFVRVADGHGKTLTTRRRNEVSRVYDDPQLAACGWDECVRVPRTARKEGGVVGRLEMLAPDRASWTPFLNVVVAVATPPERATLPVFNNCPW